MTWIEKNLKKVIYVAFLVPILLVALVSISHVTKWYGISNPTSWSVYLSIAVEIAALSTLAAIAARMGKKVYFPFAIVTLIQFIGNVFFAYQYIDIASQSFKDWVDMVDPLVQYLGVESGDFVGHKRFLAFFAGGMLPLISLSFLHMLVKFTQENKEISSNEPINENIVQPNDNVVEEPIEKEEVPTVEAKDIVGEVSRIRLSEEDLVLLEKFLNRTPQVTPEVTPQVEEELNISTQDIPEEFNQIINENFWDLTHDEKPKEETIEPTPNTLPITEETLEAIKEQYEEREDYGYSFDESLLPPQPPIESYENDLIPEDTELDGYDGFIPEEVINEITETPTPEEVKVVETPTPEEVNEVEPEKPYGFEYTQELDMALNPIETPEPTPTPVVEEEVFEEDEDIDDDVLTIDLQVQPQDDPTPIAEEEEIIEEPTPEVTETTLPPDESEEEKKN
jgi:hypothetical protein